MTSNSKKRITLFLDPAIAKQAKAHAVIEELSLTALVEKALIDYLPQETTVTRIIVEATDSK